MEEPHGPRLDRRSGDHVARGRRIRLEDGAAQQAVRLDEEGDAEEDRGDTACRASGRATVRRITASMSRSR